MKTKIEREIWFEYSHSSGAGGQHVNKASTRVVVCFSVDSSAAFTPVEKACIKRKLHNRISKDGVLRVAVEESRSQSYNKTIAVERVCELLAGSLIRKKRRLKTAATFGSKVRRLESKKKRAGIKQNRKKIRI